LGRLKADRPVVFHVPSHPTDFEGTELPVVRRTWRLVPRRVADGSSEPLLAGLFGYVWEGPVIDARCLQKDPPAAGAYPFVRRDVDRYHPVVPDPDCYCGIYGSAAPDPRWERPFGGRGSPVVNGFIELSGRIIEQDGVYRAQHATVLGPLQIVFPRPRLRIWLRLPTEPRRILVGPDGYTVLRRNSRAGWSVADWLEESATKLEQRYRTSVA
jgi:hypothetical protein